jgi:hypothetical protein
MGYRADPADFVQPRQAPGGGDLPVAEWTPVPVPAPPAGPAPQARAWKMSRYRQYRGSAGRAPGWADRRGGRRVPVRLPAVGDHAGENSLAT